LKSYSVEVSGSFKVAAPRGSQLRTSFNLLIAQYTPAPFRYRAQNEIEQAAILESWTGRQIGKRSDGKRWVTKKTESVSLGYQISDRWPFCSFLFISVKNSVHFFTKARLRVGLCCGVRFLFSMEPEHARTCQNTRFSNRWPNPETWNLISSYLGMSQNLGTLVNPK
jgi:hypothetical protein